MAKKSSEPDVLKLYLNICGFLGITVCLADGNPKVLGFSKIKSYSRIKPNKCCPNCVWSKTKSSLALQRKNSKLPSWRHSNFSLERQLGQCTHIHVTLCLLYLAIDWISPSPPLSASNVQLFGFGLPTYCGSCQPQLSVHRVLFPCPLCSSLNWT